MQIGELFLKLRADGTGLESDVESAGQSAASKLRQVFTAAAIGAALKSSIDAASNLNEAVNVTQITFGEAQGTIDSFAQTSAEALGLSERAARQATAQFGGLLLNLGFTEEQAAATSIQLTTLASDLASAFNTDPAEAAEALGSALRGEQEPIRRYNVLLSDQAVRQEAVRLGLASSASAVDENAKVQARLSLIMQQTSRYQGDFANTSESAANAQRILTAQAENNAASLGKAFLPVYERMVAVVSAAGRAFEKLPGPVQTGVVALAALAALSGPIRTVLTIGSSLGPIMAGALDRLAVGAYNAAGGLDRVGRSGRSVAVGLGVTTGALLLATDAFLRYQQRQADAAARERAIADAYDETASAGQNLVSALERLDEGASNVASGDELIRALDAIGVSAEDAARIIDEGGDGLDRLVERLAETGEVSGDTREALDYLRDAVENVGTFEDVVPASEADRIRNALNEIRDSLDLGAETTDAAEGISEVGDSAQFSEEQVSALNDALDELLAQSLDLPGAQRDLAAANEELFATIAENGVTAFNDLSEAGRNNRDALDEVVEATTAVVQKQIEQNDSAANIQATIQGQIDRLQVLRDAGLITAEAFDFYSGILRGVPATVETEVETPGLAASTAAVVDFRTRVLGIPPERQTEVFAETALAQSRIDEFNRRLAAIPRIKDVEIRLTQTGSLLGFASGTPSAPRGAALVGEYGPELVVFRGGEEVIPAPRTAQLLSDAGGAGADMSDVVAAIRDLGRDIERMRVEVDVSELASGMRRRERSQRGAIR